MVMEPIIGGAARPGGADLIKNGTTATFMADVIDASHDSAVVVDFWAPWCGPCRGFAPVFEAAAEKNADIVFAKVNTDEEQELAAHFNIRSIPTLMVFRENVIVFSQPGALRAPQLDQVIEGVKALDMKRVHEDLAKEAAQA